MTASYMEMWRLVAPEVIVVITALCVLSVDLAWLRDAEPRLRSTVATLLSVAGCAVAIGWILRAPLTASFGDGVLVLSSVAQHVQIVLLVLTMLTVLLASGASFTRHISEYLALMLMATVGMMLLVSTQNLLLIFLSLELLSLSLYVLAAFDKRSARSAEAALKYFLFGAISAAFLLFGFSLLYGLSNSTNLSTIASTLQSAPLDPLLLVAIVMMLVGLGFKVAAAPFHFWAPDVYEGAPASSAALIASGSKVAGFFILYQVLVLGLAGAEGSSAWHGYAAGWMPVVAMVAALSMVLGNLVAITQTSVRRLLAYSAIGHAGYMLLAILAHTNQSFSALLYYAITYALTVLGAFGVVAVVEHEAGGDTLAHFAGLSRRAPLVSLCMLVFMLSLAGIPPLAGFFGKFYVFASALNADHGLLWLVVLAIAMSAVSLYYYLKVLKSIYVGEPADEALVSVPVVQQVVLGLIALGVVVLGCVPSLLLHWL
ncbi:NADH-quinone oxidoreductase subunit N [Edaphobacter sp.]|uniref:NADH-quinone oxidoreductase subunit N n=1 Tax=Edaphobacter sp. TaxID=1934404 RepID=UPI002DBB860D|nr:NADH-quinone oxidoreductase subunit N [Edaphobacter sp.]HEU5342352.1 NADH-quinone oxidoreductase subunit N [Edaphobacter sp.]